MRSKVSFGPVVDQALWYKRIESQEITCSMTSEANMQFGKID